MGIIYDADDHPEWLGCWIELRTKSVVIGLPDDGSIASDYNEIDVNYTDLAGMIVAMQYALKHRRDKKQED